MIFKNFRLLFCVLAIFVYIIPQTADANAIGDADRDLFRYIHEDMENRFLDESLPIIQRIGEPQVYLGVCALLCAFGDEKMFDTGKLATAAFMESAFVAYSLKKIVGRARPLNEAEKNSFPSGHTTIAFALATVIGHEYTKLRIPLYAAALCTSFARIYLGRHYPGDVLAGATIGTLAGLHMIYWRKPILSFSF